MKYRSIAPVLILVLLCVAHPVIASPVLLTQLAELQSAAANADTAKLALILQDSLRSYDALRDYRAVFYKQEKEKGAMGSKERIFLKFEKPFKIFMGWTNTHKKGLQVMYERGRHDGKLAIHKPGLLLGLAPVIFLDQNSPWVREGSESYDIEDAGIGSFLNDFSEMVVKGAAERKLDIKIQDKDDTSLIDVSFPGTRESDAGYFAYRVVVRFDPVSSLPVQMDLYDWNNEPTGSYSYEDLSLNVGTEDAQFKQFANRHIYKLFLPQEPTAPVKNSSTQNNFSARSKN